MSMRKQFVTTIEHTLMQDARLVLLLGDIGVFGFSNAMRQHYQRVYNIGILEQSTVGLASGLSKVGLVPVVHTIAPFLVERSYEQLKIDFGYQRLGGNFVSVGASYDYAALGCTHHCPGDVSILLQIPGMEIVVPGTAQEFHDLFTRSYCNGYPTYYRLSERENQVSRPVRFGEFEIVQHGTRATVIAVGPVLDSVLEAAAGLDVCVLYCTTVSPFDTEGLRANLGDHGRVLLVEPFFTGTLTQLVFNAAGSRSLRLSSVGVRREFLTRYGSAALHDEYNGLTAPHIRSQLQDLLHG